MPLAACVGGDPACGIVRARDRAMAGLIGRRRLSIAGAFGMRRTHALARFLECQCDEDASFAQSNARAALCAIMGAVAAAHGMDAIKHAAHLPFGGFKESEVAAFLAPGWN